MQNDWLLVHCSKHEPLHPICTLDYCTHSCVFVVMRTFRLFYSSVTFRAKIPVERDIFILAVEIKNKSCKFILEYIVNEEIKIFISLFLTLLFNQFKAQETLKVVGYWMVLFYGRKDCRLWEYVGQQLTLALKRLIL